MSAVMFWAITIGLFALFFAGISAKSFQKKLNDDYYPESICDTPESPTTEAAITNDAAPSEIEIACVDIVAEYVMYIQSQLCLRSVPLAERAKNMLKRTRRVSKEGIGECLAQLLPLD
uniref:Uncharacterized protein n=1 Tax=Plectus sambesii TaxID=2011161 RepID=A0A914XIQ8_9BILA